MKGTSPQDPVKHSEKHLPHEDQVPPPSSGRLEEATRLAVEESRRVVTETQRVAQEITTEMIQVAGRLKISGDDSIARPFATVLEERASEIEALFAKQAEVADAFNIVLFGRTGAGKSSLVEALTHGDGSSVSQGESDWTTEVTPRTWESCRIYDTPGISGWGRNNTREDLEARAREAAEIADFILLCFDSQSQQASEFEKVAAWVEEFNKPTVAVLNVRNPVWRLPPRVPVGAARVSLSRTVAEHVGNITAELAAIGMQATPVVAITTKRALFARATLPFHGPDSESIHSHRKNHSIEKLESWSNFPALEMLLVRCIQNHAVAFRTGVLHDQLRGVLLALLAEAEQVSKTASQGAEILENQTISPLLKLLGYPVTDCQRAPYTKDGVDLLATLEEIRGKFQAPQGGEFEVYVSQLLASRLGALRSNSLGVAEEIVAFAFDKGGKISGEEIQSKCFPKKEMEQAALEVMKSAQAFLVRRARLAYRDAASDLEAVAQEMSGIKGGAGRIWKYSALGLKLGGTAVLGTFAATNFWNPLGWAAGVAAAIGLVGGIAAALLGLGGGQMRKHAEQRKLAERRKALAEIRRGVHEIFDSYVEKVAEEAAKIASAAASEVVLPAVKKALAFRDVEAVGHGVLERAETLAGSLPTKANPQKLLLETKAICEREASAETPALACRIWLGESWIDDPNGLKIPFENSSPKRTRAYDPGLLNSLFSGFRDVWIRVVAAVSSGAGKEWLASVRKTLRDDSLAQLRLTELVAIADRGRPRLQLVGDYNAGKSSFIKRLLLDAGLPVPVDLHIRADPTTDRERVYEWKGLDLIDTPGFQSCHAGHTAAALRSIPDASAIIFLFQPNLVLGDDQFLRLALHGDRASGRTPKLPRTFFVINRSDELGIDPEDDPGRFKDLSERKRKELAGALASRGINVSYSQILCMASDPYGMVGDRKDATSASFDACRHFDGFKPFIESFREVENDLRQKGLDRSLLEGGIARLTDLSLERENILTGLSAQRDVLVNLLALIEEQTAEGLRLRHALQAKLTRLLEEFAFTLRDDVLSELDPDKLRLKANQIGTWWMDEALAVEIQQWGKTAHKEIELWRGRAEEALQRRLDSRDYRATIGKPSLDSAPPLPSASSNKSGLAHTVEKSGRLLGGATRDMVYSVGKALKFNFKPWGAVKLARQLGKVGGIIAVVGVVWDGVDAIWTEFTMNKREKSRKEISEWIVKTVPAVITAVGEGDTDEPNILRMVDDCIEEIDEGMTHLREQLRLHEEDIHLEQKHRETYRRLITEAEGLLDTNIWDESPEIHHAESQPTTNS